MLNLFTKVVYNKMSWSFFVNRVLGQRLTMLKKKSKLAFLQVLKEWINSSTSSRYVGIINCGMTTPW